MAMLTVGNSDVASARVTQYASTSPNPLAANASTSVSVSNCRTIRNRVAPRERRMATSRRRRTPRLDEHRGDVRAARR